VKPRGILLNLKKNLGRAGVRVTFVTASGTANRAAAARLRNLGDGRHIVLNLSALPRTKGTNRLDARAAEAIVAEELIHITEGTTAYEEMAATIRK